MIFSSQFDHDIAIYLMLSPTLIVFAVMHIKQVVNLNPELD